MSCTFCGSKKIIVETPYIDRSTGEHETTYCCKAQKQNHRYQSNKFHPIYGHKPPLEKVEKL